MGEKARKTFLFLGCLAKPCNKYCYFQKEVSVVTFSSSSTPSEGIVHT